MGNQVTWLYYWINAVNMKIAVFWDVTLCTLAGGYHCFGGAYCLCLQDSS